MPRTMPLLLALLACGGETPTAPPEPAPAEKADPAPAMPEEDAQAAAVARTIDADPTQADAALAEAGMTEEDYRKVLYEIAQDPVRAAAFAEALR